MRRRSFLPVLLAAAALAVPLGATPAAAAPAAAAPAAAAPASAAPAVAAGPVTPVPALDLTRYQGRWLQLAAIPSPFQAECARDTQAVYTLLPDGLVRVANSCVRADGSVSAIEGRATVAGPAPSQLLVSFVQIGGVWQFQPPFGADYWVLGLSRSYGWAVVGDPARRSGFVLSRTPTLPVRDVVDIVRVLLRNGYDPCAFVLTPTAGGVPVPIGCPGRG